MRTLTLSSYFSNFSLALLVLAGGLLVFLIRNQEVSQMVMVAEDRNVSASQILGNLLYQDINSLTNDATHIFKSGSTTEDHARKLHDKIVDVIKGSDIVKVKVYNLAGITVFSTEARQIGENKSQNAGFIRARDGFVASELVHRDQFSAFEGKIEDVDLLSSYVPVVSEGKVVAVFEQYQDVTKLLQQIEQSLWQIGAYVFAVLAGLYAMLLWVVRRAAKALRVQEARIESINRDLDRRVAERTYQLEQSQLELSIAAVAFESQQSMLITDANKVILRTNHAFSDITGYQPEDLIGHNVSILNSGKHDKSFYVGMWESIRKTGYWEGELWGRRKDGVLYPKWLTISAVKNLEGVVSHYVGTYIDISERKLAEEKIHNLANYDQLTGLPNRAQFLSKVRESMLHNERNGSLSALMLFDLDNFKALNDTKGHAYGDELLQQVANRLSQKVSPEESVARLGGDEFVILLRLGAWSLQQAKEEVAVLANDLINAIGRPFYLSEAEYFCSASVGVTLFKGRELTVDDLFRQVDLAMYQSKSDGGNAFSFFDLEMEKSAFAHAAMDVDLRLALSQEEFELYFQPQVDAQTERVVGAEALVRWIHPEKGIISPIDFIPHSERTGLIVPIGYWVLQKACEQLAIWANSSKTSELILAVNVSAQQFQFPGFVAEVISTIHQTGANPQRLKLELTESVFAGNTEDVVAMMFELKKIGIGFSLDDFGTGYSSLAYLSRLPLDQLKIDRSFVSAIESGDKNVAICAASISLAHNLKLKVVAEGVETEAQRHFLTTVHHCDLIQGFYYGRPMPIGDFCHYLKR